MTGKQQTRFNHRARPLSWHDVRRLSKAGRKCLYDDGGMIHIGVNIPQFVSDRVQEMYPNLSLALGIREFLVNSIRSENRENNP